MTTKEKVLTLLKSKQAVLSGEKIAQQLNVSRTAIWKAIKELEKSGYRFEHTKNGYRYLPTDILQAAELTQALPMMKTIHVTAASASTMKEAKMAAFSDQLKTPALYLTETQTGGYGRFNRPFFSPKGQGIYMSLLLQPKRLFSELPQYTLLAAVAVAQAIDDLTGKTTEIKWVNDIYIAGKKICGILSEATSDVETGQITTIVIGIGLNFSTPQDQFPAELQEKATSIFPDGQPNITRSQLIEKIWQHFFDLLEALPAMDYLKIYREKSLVLGRTVHFTRQGISYDGIATAVTNLGELVVKTPKNEEMVLSSGEISLDSY